MTRQKLEDYYYLKKEIEHLKNRLLSVKEEIEQTDDPSPDLMEIYQVLLKSLNRAITEFKEVGEYIASIEDDYIKQLFFLRYVEGLSWKHVAAAAGGKKRFTALDVLAKDTCKRTIKEVILCR